MKFIPHAAALSLAATQSMAGGLSDAIVEAPAMEPVAVAEPEGSAGWIIPVLIVGALVAIAVSSGDDDDDSEDGGEPMQPVPDIVLLDTAE